MKKYELFKKEGNLWRIRRISDGLVGGLIEKEENLSHDGDCFVYDEAKVYENAKVEGNAQIYNYSQVFGDAKVYDNALVFGNTKVYGESQIYDNAKVCGDTIVYGKAQIRFEVKSNRDFIIIGGFRNNGHVTINILEKKVVYGSFYGTFEEFEKYIDEKIF